MELTAEQIRVARSKMTSELVNIEEAGGEWMKEHGDMKSYIHS